MDEIKEGELILAPANASNEQDPPSLSKQFQKKIGRGPFLRWLGKLVLGIGAVGTIANKPSPIEATGSKTLYVDPVLKRSETEPTKIIGKLEVINETSPGNQVEAEKQVTEIKNIIEEILKLNRLGVKVHLLDINSSQLKSDNQYGIYLTELKSDGAGAVSVSKPDGTSELLVAFQPGNPRLRELITHEENHFLYPPFENFNFLLTKQEVDEIKGVYNNFQEAYKKRLAKDQYTTQYDMTILQGTYPKIGENGWAYFLNLVGLGNYSTSAIPREEVEKIAASTDNPTWSAIFKKFLQYPALTHFTRNDLAKYLAQGYWEKGASFLKGTEVAADNYQRQFDDLLGNAEREAWADLGMWAMQYPEAAKDIFPEYYAALATVYQAISGQSLEQLAPKLRSQSRQEIIEIARYKITDALALDLIKKYLSESYYNVYLQDNNPEKIAELRQKMKKDIEKLNWTDQQTVASTVEIFLEDPEGLKSTLNTFN